MLILLRMGDSQHVSYMACHKMSRNLTDLMNGTCDMSPFTK